MEIAGWTSLPPGGRGREGAGGGEMGRKGGEGFGEEIGRASCRERV